MDKAPITENDIIETLNGTKNNPRLEIGDGYFPEYDNCEIKITGSPKLISSFCQLRPHSNCNYILIDYFHQYAYFLTKKQMHNEIYVHKIASMSHKTDREWSIRLDYNTKNRRKKTQQKFERFEKYRNAYIEMQIFGK